MKFNRENVVMYKIFPAALSITAQIELKKTNFYWIISSVEVLV